MKTAFNHVGCRHSKSGLDPFCIFLQKNVRAYTSYARGYVRVRVCMHAWLFMYCMYARLGAVRVCMRVYVRVYARAYARTHAVMCVYAGGYGRAGRACMHIHVCACKRGGVLPTLCCIPSSPPPVRWSGVSLGYEHR